MNRISMHKINIAEKLASVNEHWSPRIVAELNGQQVKVAKIRGEFLWHHHEHEDELFMVVKGTLRMRFRDHDVLVGQGECIVVPAGVEHMPVADEEVELMLFEPASTLNTGNVVNERTIRELGRV